jgi:hypothetical protein
MQLRKTFGSHPVANLHMPNQTPIRTEPLGRPGKLGTGLGFIDCWRELNPDEATEGYTYWGFRFGGRQKNNGWRLDYFVVSERLKSALKVVVHSGKTLLYVQIIIVLFVHFYVCSCFLILNLTSALLLLNRKLTESNHIGLMIR